MSNISVAETLTDRIREEEPGFASGPDAKFENTITEDVETLSRGKIRGFEEEVSDFSLRPFGETIKKDIFFPDEIKRINRQISKKIPHERKIELIQGYNYLAEKKFNEGLSKEEERQFIYIKWQIDRIDDAEIGEGLDRLEKFTEGVEFFADEISQLIQKFDPTKKQREIFKK